MEDTRDMINTSSVNSPVKKMLGLFKETLSILVMAFLLSMLLKAYVVEARVIPSGSMLPTIQPGDRVLVNKFIYRFESPQRNDVIVFEPPLETGQHEDFIKRVIGLPGETVEVRNGQVLIDGDPLNEDFILEEPNYNYGPVKVPLNCLFVMGDNRNQSFDSHYWDQWLKIEKVKGEAFYTYWPIKRMGVME